MGLIRFIFSKKFLKNLLLAMLLVLFIPGVLYIYLSWYTGHGERHEVPDVRGITVQEASDKIESAELSYLIVDSVYTEGAVPGMVFEQSPLPFSEVKRDRTIYLTVYRSTPPSETLKVAEGTNERVAEIILQNKGIRFEKQFEEHAYLTGMVVRVLHRGKELSPQSQVKRGDKVTLVVGMKSNEKVPIPDLKGLTLDSALIVLSSVRLAHGVALYDRDVLTEDDSLACRVYRQTPSAEGDKPILVGSPVDLFLGLKPDDFFDQGIDQNEEP